MNPTRPGIQTTEFWLTAITSLLGMATGLGFIGPSFASEHGHAIQVIAMGASILAPPLYGLGRSWAKNHHAEAQRVEALLAAARIPQPAALVDPQAPVAAPAPDPAGPVDSADGPSADALGVGV